VLEGIADVWALTVSPVPSTTLDRLGPASRLVLAGAGAVVAVAEAMAGRSGMDFGDQVLVVTDAPGLRQLTGIASALTGSRATPRCLRATQGRDIASSRGFERATQAIVSADAPAEAADAAVRLARELGAVESA
jgi:hypothetical protein